MKRILFVSIIILIFVISFGLAKAAEVEPNEVMQPGTQPGEVNNLETPDRCDNCHGGYDQNVEPNFNWRGSMMSQAGRDPIFWASVAIAEQDFDGSGDLCLRCHSPKGWYDGRSTPTDGSDLMASDAEGVMCDTCHKITNTNNTEHLGEMNVPFIANDGNTPATGYYSSGMLSLWGGTEKLGPYSTTTARHQFMQSIYHRSDDFCGSCHDVSNPAVGDLAPNNGKQENGDPVVASGVLGSELTEKAAFNNFPYQYGVVERTYSEFKSSALPQTRVSNYVNLPPELQAGAIEMAYQHAGGDYEDGTPRYFTCQTCHIPPVTGVGSNKSDSPLRTDLPLHDMTGGNYWSPDAILYQDAQGMLRLGGGLSTLQESALDAGKTRAINQLEVAASLDVTGDILKVTNLTGHKLISGYPEGRRMWLNIKWYDINQTMIREDGAYGDIDVMLDGEATTVRTILDLDDPNTKVYEVHPAITQPWAEKLIQLGYPTDLPLNYDRITGEVDTTLGELAAKNAGDYEETFHFVLNNYVAEDNRIPPYGFDYDEARRRNSLPIPESQYGDPGTGGTYQHWDEIQLNPPPGAISATISLMYQPTSWEYVQFLYLANNGQITFLADEGTNLYQAWRNTIMAEPVVMTSTTWESEPIPMEERIFLPLCIK